LIYEEKIELTGGMKFDMEIKGTATKAAPHEETPETKLVGKEFVGIKVGDDDDVFVVRKGRDASPWETLAFILLCAVASMGIWYLWKNTEHRPRLSEPATQSVTP
jgi:hypothetical protein